MLATPLLVSMIEEGFFNNNISQAIIDNYLSKSNLKNIEGLILGCTHFPLIKKEVEHFCTAKTEVIDSTEIVAEYTKRSSPKAQFTQCRTRRSSPLSMFQILRLHLPKAPKYFLVRTNLKR